MRGRCKNYIIPKASFFVIIQGGTLLTQRIYSPQSHKERKENFIFPFTVGAIQKSDKILNWAIFFECRMSNREL